MIPSIAIPSTYSSYHAHVSKILSIQGLGICFSKIPSKTISTPSVVHLSFHKYQQNIAAIKPHGPQIASYEVLHLIQPGVKIVKKIYFLFLIHVPLYENIKISINPSIADELLCTPKINVCIGRHIKTQNFKYGSYYTGLDSICYPIVPNSLLHLYLAVFFVYIAPVY